jgi:hypothetical protein
MDINKYKLPDGLKPGTQKLSRPPKPKKLGKFLKGPVPLDWLTKAGKQPGKALHVANVLWYLAGLKKTTTVSLSSKVLRSFGVKRNAGYRGLENLENVGLVSVERHTGRFSVVTILDVEQGGGDIG